MNEWEKEGIGPHELPEKDFPPDVANGRIIRREEACELSILSPEFLISRSFAVAAKAARLLPCCNDGNGVSGCRRGERGRWIARHGLRRGRASRVPAHFPTITHA